MVFLPEFDPADVHAGRDLVERLTTDAAALQRDLLDEILARNAQTEYLRRFLDSADAPAAAGLREYFKKRVPVSGYEDVKPYVDRIASGEPSSLLCSEPFTDFCTSSGTSGGKMKLLPCTGEEYNRKLFFFAVQALVRNMYPHDNQHKDGKGMYLMFTFPGEPTLSGLPVRSTLTAYYSSSQFQDREFGEFDRCTSPLEAILCPDGKQSMYCQLLCGLLRRDSVDRVGATFAVGFVRGIRFLEDHWEEMCSNIRTGQLSDWITHGPLRDAVAERYLQGPYAAMADEIASECAKKPWGGIVRRLWTGARSIRTIVTGSLSQYIPLLELYGGGLPLVSSLYGSTECLAGINLRPLDPPSRVSYALLPNIAYFEFEEVEHGDGEMEQGIKGDVDYGNTKVVDLVDVKIGRCYELVVTTLAGLYRYRVGDLLTVSGFYNATPLFRFSGRHGVALCVDSENTSEEVLLKAISEAVELQLRPLGYMLVGSTAYADIYTSPGHYILFWELASANSNHTSANGIDQAVMENCCLAVEECFNEIYRELRHDGSIGALEIRVLGHGAFSALMDFFVSKGTSATQYKTPTVIRSKDAMLVLENRVVRRFFSQAAPDYPCAKCDST